MSRTVRRKNDEASWWVGTDWVLSAGGYYKRVRLEGKELAKALARHHSDMGYGRTTNKCKYGSDERGLRMLAKEEIARWMKDPDHPIQVPTKRHLRDYWD